MKNQKPNILILYSDQHSARVLGCYGNREAYTPHLDGLAAEGVKLNNAYTQNPVCTPSRMAMLSGQYVHNFGYYGLMGENPVGLPNLFKHFKECGYRTGVAGKTHTPAGWLSDTCDFVADGYGFEVPVVPSNLTSVEGCQGLKNNDYSIYLAEIGLLADRDDKILSEWYEKNRHMKGQCVDARYSRIPKEHSFEAWTAKCTNEFIETCAADEMPFCFWMTMPRPHQTYAPAKEFWDMYEGAELTLPPNAENDMRNRTEAARETLASYKESTLWMAFEPKNYEEARKRVLRGYYACVTQMDDAVGRVLDKLKQLGIERDTIIVYTTDHGEFAGEHGIIEKAPGIGFGCVTRIPMIFSWKDKLEAGAERNSIMEAVDIFPTLCELARVEPPDWVDGKSAVKILNEDSPIKEFAVTENPLTKTIHTKKYKLTQYLPEFQGEDFGELFDLELDPYELNNLYFKPDYQAVVNELRYHLYCWLVRTTRIKTANPTIPATGMKEEVSAGLPWDLADRMGIYGMDGKIGESFYKELLKKGMKNYI